jgi:hypothetical protein
MMRFTFPHRHAFQGSRLTIEDAEMSEGMCVVEFGDGVAMIGEWHPDGDNINLTVPAYRTAKGTDIDALSWRLVRDQDGQWRARRRA